MSQTERDQIAIRTLLADNAIGAISPQDLRDALASLMGYGGLVLSEAGAPSTLNSVGTAFKLIDVFNTISSQSSDVNAGGVVVTLSPTFGITLTAAGIYKLDFFASFSSSANNVLTSFASHVGGSAGLIQVDRFIGSGPDTAVTAMSQIAAFDAGDVLDCRVKIDAGTTNLTFLAVGFTAHRVG
jgi:hypothetical protein